ncbi:MAG: PAS domain S-box protein, partial [Planctomycetes bacterium]|nr:PAS domain S-box protein [Planctomycetota bacterium]
KADFEAMVHPDDRERFWEAVSVAIEFHSPLATEFRAILSSGETRWFSNYGRCDYDEEGQALRMVGTVSDITERKKAEKLLVEGESRLRRILDGLLEGCQIIDNQLRYVYLNESGLRHARQSLENLVGKRMSEAYPGIEATEVFGVIHRCLWERVPARVETPFTFPDGSQGVFELSIQPTTEGVLVLSNEITDRKQVEESLRRSESNLRAAQRVAGLGVWDWNLSDKLWWSDELYRIFGLAPSEFTPTVDSFLETVIEEDREIIEPAINHSIENNLPYRLEFRFLRSDGDLRWLDTYGVVERNELSQPVRFWGVCQDITDRKRAESKLLISEQMLRESEEKYRLSL